MTIIQIHWNVEFMTTEEFTIIMPEEQLKKTWIDKIQALDGFDVIILPFILLEGFVKDIMGVTENKVSQGHERKDMDAL